MKKSSVRSTAFVLAMALIMCFGFDLYAQNGTIADRETADDFVPAGYARWIKMTVAGGFGSNETLNDDFGGMQVLVDLNLDGDNNYNTPTDPTNPTGLGLDSYYALGDAGDIISARPGENGANDLYFYIKIKQSRDSTHYYPDGVGYNTDLRPRIKLTNSGQLRIIAGGLPFPILNETDLTTCSDGIKPIIRKVFYYDDGSGGTTAVAGVHKGNMTAFDGYIDRVDIIWSEPMNTSNTAASMAIFTGLGSTIYNIESIGTWNSTNQRFSFYVISSQPNTGISPILTYNRPASASDRFREAATSQNQYYADSQSRSVTDKAGPAIISAKTLRAQRRQPLGAALASRRIEVTFSEPVKLSSVNVGLVDFEVHTTATNPEPNNIQQIISPSGTGAVSSVYQFQLTTNFASENETGTIQYIASGAVTDVLGNFNGISPADEPPARPTPGRGPLVNIKDGIFPNILEVRTVDAALPAQSSTGGPNGWGYLDYVDVVFDHNMNASRISTSGFSVSGLGIQTIGGTGTWVSATTFRIPLVASAPKIPNTGIIPTVIYTNPGNPNGLIDAVNGGLAENLLASDTAVSASNGLAVKILDKAGPAIIKAYTAGRKRVRVSFSELINTTGWPTTPGTSIPPGKFKWIVGPSFYDATGTQIFFTGLSSVRRDSVVYLNHTGSAWAKTDSGAINFFAQDVVNDLASTPNGNKQWDEDYSLNAPTRAKQGSDVKIKRDNIAPILEKLETVDLNKNGKLDHYRFVFSDLSPIFPLQSFRPNLWSIKGYDGQEKQNLQVDLSIYSNPPPGSTPINSFGDTVEVFVKFDETTGPGPDPTPYGGDTADRPDVVVGEGNGFGDWADNFMDPLGVGLTLEKDKAGPAIIQARTINTTEVELLLSEDIQSSTVQTGDFNLIIGAAIPLLSAKEVSPGVIHLSAFDQSYWLPTETGTVAFTGTNVVFDDISGADNGNLQTYSVYVNDNAASQFDINLAVPGDQIRGVPFQIEVIARDSHGNIDKNFPERIRFSSNLTQNEIDLPEGSQELVDGVGYFHVTCWVVTSELQISVSVNSDRYARYFSTSDSINVIEPVIDNPDTLIVKDYRGADGNGDQGGYVTLTFDYSQNHPGIGSKNIIDYYQIYREVENNVFHWGTIMATDTTGSGADSLRIVMWTGDNVESKFWVRAVWNPGWPGTTNLNNTLAGADVKVPEGYILLRNVNPILIRSQGRKVTLKNPKLAYVEGDGEGQVVSASVMASGRAVDNIPPLAPARFQAERQGVAVKLHWPMVTRGTNGMPELFGVKYEIYSHTKNAYFDPDAEGTLEATVSDTSYMVNTEQLRKFFCIRAVDSDNKSALSLRTGKYGFALDKGENPVYNFLSLPLVNNAYDNAKTLAQDVSGVDAVLKLDKNTNAYTTFFLPGINFGNNFSLAAGMPVLISANKNAPDNWFYTGDVPLPATLQFQLNHAEKGTYNEIILPLDRTDITTADQLAKDIGGVDVVLKIDPATNGFSKFWLPSINYGENFTIEPGEAVLINVNTNAPDVWPEYTGQGLGTEPPIAAREDKE